MHALIGALVLIDLELDTRPKSFLIYHMAPIELRELKTQLQDIFDKKSVDTSVRGA